MESIPVELYGFGECDACQKYGVVFITGEAGCVFLCGDCLLTAQRETKEHEHQTTVTSPNAGS